MHGLVGYDPDRCAFDAAESYDDVLGELGVDLAELAVVEHMLDHAVHVVGLVRGVRDHGIQFGIVLGHLTPSSLTASTGGSSRLLEGR